MLGAQRKGSIKMEITYVTITRASNGEVVIDDKPGAHERYLQDCYLQERHERQTRWKREEMRRKKRNPVYKMAVSCGII